MYIGKEVLVQFDMKRRHEKRHGHAENVVELWKFLEFGRLFTLLR